MRVRNHQYRCTATKPMVWLAQQQLLQRRKEKTPMKYAINNNIMVLTYVVII